MFSTALTSFSSLAGRSWTPEARSTSRVAAPQGTGGAHTTTVLPGAARSAAERIPAGIVERLGMPLEDLMGLHQVLSQVIAASQRNQWSGRVPGRLRFPTT